MIPAFAVGRTQEIVYRLNQLWNENEVPRIDVFVDSPLAVNVTDVFRLHPECYDRQYALAVLNDAIPWASSAYNTSGASMNRSG
jgi:metallo-beta-lactamase family protein